jgi:hypothetical protein
MRLKFKEEPSKVLYLKYSFVWNDHVRNEVLHIGKERNILHTINRRNANWVGHTSCRNCLLKQVSRYWMSLRKRQDTGI